MVEYRKGYLVKLDTVEIMFVNVTLLEANFVKFILIKLFFVKVACRDRRVVSVIFVNAVQWRLSPLEAVFVGVNHLEKSSLKMLLYCVY